MSTRQSPINGTPQHLLTFLVKFTGRASVEATTAEEAIQLFQRSSTPKKASYINDTTLYALRVINTRYAGAIEADQRLALCYKQIPIFHVFKNYDAGPEFWTPSSRHFSWQRHDLDRDWNLGAQFDALNELPPENYQPDPSELYLSHDLTEDNDAVALICWQIERALQDPDLSHACRNPL